MDWQHFVSAFGLIFVAELGDKTQLAVMTQTCKFRRPWPILIGASLALSLVTAIGVIGGQAVGALIPADVIRFIAAGIFVIMGVLIWREARSAQAEAETCSLEEVACDAHQTGWDWRAFGSTFTLLFFAELGDKTQLAVLGLTSRHAAPWEVFIGGALALTAVTVLGVVGGRQLCRWIPEWLLLRISAVAFVVMGVLMGIGIL